MSVDDEDPTYEDKFGALVEALLEERRRTVDLWHAKRMNGSEAAEKVIRLNELIAAAKAAKEQERIPYRGTTTHFIG